ncbi:MAG: hypothetical protein C4308_01410 [Chitinophagaceae bacterium]
MKAAIKLLLVFLVSMIIRTCSFAQIIDSTNILFNFDTVAKNLSYPWEITYGPDDSLWITEARGYRVLRISSTRTQAHKNNPPQQILKLPLGTGEINFSRSIGTWPQGGMEGLVIHPDFFSGKPWVYLAYVYKTIGGCPANPSSPCYFRSKIVRCRFYFAGDAGNPAVPAKDTLVIMDTVISNLPGSNDHNSGRLAISPMPEMDGTYKLYFTIGDMGAGQFNNSSRPNNAQDIDTAEGKILRLNTEPDGDGIPGSPIHDYDKWRAWIPNDNPINHSVFTSLKTPVFSYGHRNAQGLVWGNVNGIWRLYSSEHGDKSDDEINIIQSAKNYGWPKVAGLCDDNYTTADSNPNNDLLAGQIVTNEIASFCNVTPSNTCPVFSFFNWPGNSIPSSGANIYTWPTIAPSSIDLYAGNIPGWKYSLLVTSLKYGMYRMKLKSTGDFIDSTSSSNTVDTFPLLHGWRVRDVAINPNPNSGTFWVVIDSTGSTSGPTGGFNGSSNPTRDGGKVLKLSYKTLLTLPIRNDNRLRPVVVNDMVSIFPNPVHNTIYVHGKKQLHKPLRFQVVDINGYVLKEMLSYQNDFSVNVSSLLPGVYVVKLYNGYDAEVQIQKILKR